VVLRRGFRVQRGTKHQALDNRLRSHRLARRPPLLDLRELHDWTDAYPWTDDEILTWISIYQFSNAGPGASTRIYYKTIHSQKELTEKRLDYNGKVKLGISYFPKDICAPPSEFGRKLGEVVFERRHKDGGHFAAHERLELLVGDLMEMFGAEGGARDAAQKVAV